MPEARVSNSRSQKAPVADRRQPTRHTLPNLQLIGTDSLLARLLSIVVFEAAARQFEGFLLDSRGRSGDDSCGIRRRIGGGVLAIRVVNHGLQGLDHPAFTLTTVPEKPTNS
jgi:hypothetical protein